MTDLLTTRQVQELLRVDRTTIYRMVESGQLPAVRVGKQWRFAREQVETWLQARVVTRPADNLAATRPLDFAAAMSTPAASRPTTGSGGSSDQLRDLLSLPCTQLLQDTFADMLGVMMVITDMDGYPMTRISNPCGFFAALTAHSTGATSHCVATWQQLASEPALEPKWSSNEMGLLCTRALIRVGSELKGMVMLGGIAPEPWPAPDTQIAALARQFGAEPTAVVASARAVHQLDAGARDRALHSVQRIADVFARIIEDRNVLWSQWQALAASAGGQR